VIEQDRVVEWGVFGNTQEGFSVCRGKRVVININKIGSCDLTVHVSVCLGGGLDPADQECG
jgi:hypothetical protein